MELGDGDSEVDLDLLDDDSYQLVLPSGESQNSCFIGCTSDGWSTRLGFCCSVRYFHQWFLNFSFCYNSYLAFNNVLKYISYETYVVTLWSAVQ